MALFTILCTASVLVTAVRSIPIQNSNENLETNALLKQLLVGQQENTKLIQKLLQDNERLHRQDQQLSEENRHLKNKLNNLEERQGKVAIFACKISVY